MGFASADAILIAGIFKIDIKDSDIEEKEEKVLTILEEN